MPWLKRLSDDCRANGEQTILTNADGLFQLYRTGDAGTSRNIHAAVYDALRLTHVK